MVYANDVWRSRNDGLWHDVSHMAAIARLTGSDWTGNSLADQGAFCSKVFLNATLSKHETDLFHIECANTLLKYARRFERSLKDSQADLVDPSRLALKSTPTADLMENALLLASEVDLPAYVVCYAVLAQQLGILLVTADQPFARKLEFPVYIRDLDVQLSEE